MLRGKTITLRPVRASDIDTLRELDLDLDSRGDYWPLSIMSEPAYRQEYEHTGFWGENFGRLLMEDKAGKIIGEIMYFKTVMYMDELEIGERRKRRRAAVADLQHNVNHVAVAFEPVNLGRRKTIPTLRH